MKFFIYTMLVSLITLTTNQSYAQNDITSHTSLPKFVNFPMPPESASLGKFLDIPIGLSTGTISPNIPIYKI